MEAARIVVKEAAVGPVELVQAVIHILRGVAVHNIEQHDQSHLMGTINERF